MLKPPADAVNPAVLLLALPQSWWLHISLLISTESPKTTIEKRSYSSISTNSSAPSFQLAWKARRQRTINCMLLAIATEEIPTDIVCRSRGVRLVYFERTNVEIGFFRRRRLKFVDSGLANQGSIGFSKYENTRRNRHPSS